MGWKIFTVTMGMAAGLLSLGMLPDGEGQVRGSVHKALLLLQKSSCVFVRKSKCVSCHHEDITAMACAIGGRKGLVFDDSFRVQRYAAMARALRQDNDSYHTLGDIGPVSLGDSWTLIGLDAEGYPADLYTDAVVAGLMNRARMDGSFIPESGRPPFASGVFHSNAACIHAIRIYAAPGRKRQVDMLTERTRKWMLSHGPGTQQELVFQLLGLYWCGVDTVDTGPVARRLLGMQGAGGGWSEQETMEPDAYATGEALYALFQTGWVRPDDPVYRRGVEFLLKTQGPDGAWIGESRSYPVQPFINSDFPPYDENQYYSAFSTSWASLALAIALPEKD